MSSWPNSTRREMYNAYCKLVEVVVIMQLVLLCQLQDMSLLLTFSGKAKFGTHDLSSSGEQFFLATISDKSSHEVSASSINGPTATVVLSILFSIGVVVCSVY